MKYLTRTTLAVGLLAAGAIIGTALPSSSSSPTVTLEASPSSSTPSPIVVEEAPRLAQAAQVATAAPVAAEAATPAQEAPTPPPAPRIADSITVTAPAAPAPPDPMTLGEHVDPPASTVWVRLADGHCMSTQAANVDPGWTVDPTCPAGQPVTPGIAPPPASAVITVRVADGSCARTGTTEAIMLGQATGDPTCPR